VLIVDEHLTTDSGITERMWFIYYCGFSGRVYMPL